MSVHKFPEVYHGQGISEAVFSAPARRVTAQGDNTTYRRQRRLQSGACCGYRAQGGVERIEDPVLPFFGSAWKKERTEHRLNISICLTSAYAWHTHILTICICLVYTYAEHLPILNICTRPVQ
ncbi:hypothetical protein UM29_004457 [Salmonella enterica subsp. enterica serovar Reading]|nr:hypothetical protein [Salmonella enterica subsp. enterica serovar Reading]